MQEGRIHQRATQKVFYRKHLTETLEMNKLLSERRCKFVCTVYLIHQQTSIDGRLIVEVHTEAGWANRRP